MEQADREWMVDRPAPGKEGRDVRETAAARRTRVRLWISERRDCAICGLKRINVVHEPDPDNAPEGLGYYSAIRDRLHAFTPREDPALEQALDPPDGPVG